MNYLAHARLSFLQPEIIVGNMISDFVKGKKRFDFSEAIQQGIMLHRKIDTFTDEHVATKEAKQFFKADVGLYAGAFVDVAYDHFLANDVNEFANEKNENMLMHFSQLVYGVLNNYTAVMPEKFAHMFLYMQKDNWLYHYKTLKGIQQSFAGLARRAKYLNDSKAVFKSFEANYEALQQCYTKFFPEVKKFAYDELKKVS